MKYWEIVKSVTENPALCGVAVIDSIRYELYVNDSGTLESKTYYLKLGTNGTSIGKAGNIDFDGWEIVRQPIPWQEAIQAWADGKVVYVKNKAGGRVFRHGGEGETMYLLQSEIATGIWYVED